ncbi:alpha/beta-hydrolase [Stipitochalara longipes BDJ]|nr:alpha/beta-hydrolase [Stipitochalara longipes BDJ]
MKFSQTFVLLGASLTGTLAQNATNSSAPVMFPLSSDSQFAFNLEEWLALANGGGAATGEVLRAASQITPGDFESWYREFNFLANSLHNIGVNTTYPTSKRDTLFRSASYYRGADFFLHGNWSDPRIETLWDSQLADFNTAISLLEVPGERFSVHADGFDTIGIFYSPGQINGKRGSSKRPTLLIGSGFDGSQEDLFHALGHQALERGWNFVTYEGPGQPTARRQQNLGFRSDWWNVVTPVVDYLETRNDVDTERIALQGLSFGGLLAPRAASREHRLAAVLAIEGLYNFQAPFVADLGEISPKLPLLFKDGNKTEFDKAINAVRANKPSPTAIRWYFDQGLWSFKLTSPFDWITSLGEYTLTKDIVDNITCPVFVGSGQDDLNAPGQPETVAAWLGSKGHYHLFPTALGAGEHCQLGAELQLAQVTQDWLSGVFEAVGKAPTNGTKI